MQGSNIAARMGGWSARHRWWALLIWIVFVAGAVLLGNAVGTLGMQGFEDENGESQLAAQVYDKAGFPDVARETVLVQSRNGDLVLSSAAFRQAVTDLKASIEGTGRVTEVRSPYDSQNPAPVAKDKHTALVLFAMKGEGKTAHERVQPVLDAVAGAQDRHPALRIEEAGPAGANKILGVALGADFQRAEFLSLPITAVILLIAFGTLLPMIIPITLSMTAFLAATGLLALASQLLHVDDRTRNLMLLVGLAVGVDYSLFYVRREREERAAGRSKERALLIAAATSGRAVLISGLTVMVATAGLFLTGNGVFMAFAEGTILVVLTAMAGSVTVLPAVLSICGDAIDARLIHGVVRLVTRGRVTWRRRIGGRTGGGRTWNAILSVVLRRPLVAALLATAALGALAIPAFHMKIGQAGIDDLQGEYAIAQTFKRIDKAFPGGSDPALLVVKGADVTHPRLQEAFKQFKEQALATGQANEPIGVVISPDKTVAAISIGIAGEGPQDDASIQAVHMLRDQVIPRTFGQVPGVETHVTGGVAGTMDFNAQLERSAPWVFGFVLVLAFVLLLVSFRSVMIAVTAIVLNLLSVVAAYGVLVLVFQDGRGEALLGFTSSGMIVNWLPLFLFVILFGLSMDYQVFILSRIREAHDRGLPTDQAISLGIRASAGVVTSAALIMVGVFAVFGTMSLLSFKQMGMGLAVAILIDATIVRAILLPATMKLLGGANWYLPRWLGWLPRLSHGESEEDEDPVVVPIELSGTASRTGKA